MFGVNAPHKRGLGAPTQPKRGHSDDEFVPDSQADRDHRQKLALIKEGRKMEKMLLGNRSAVAAAMVQAGGKINLDAAGLAVMNGSFPSSLNAPATCPPKPPEKPKKKDSDRKKGKKKDKKRTAKKKDKKKKSKKKEKKKGSKKKKSSSSSSSSDSTASSGEDPVDGPALSSVKEPAQDTKRART